MTQTILKIMRDRFDAHIVYALMQAPPYQNCTITVLSDVGLEPTHVTWSTSEVVVIPKPKQITRNGTAVQFEIIDFEEVVDDRICALRHYDTAKPHLFRVNISNVLVGLAKNISERHGYMESSTAQFHRYGCFEVQRSSYYGVQWYVDKIRLHDYQELKDYTGKSEFTGTYTECEKCIRELEVAVRQAFDNFLTHDSKPSGLTPAVMCEMFDQVLFRAQRLSPKVKDKRNYGDLLSTIVAYKKDVLAMGRKEVESLDKQEN